MTSTTKASLIRVLIPLLRLLPFYGGLYAVMMWEYVADEPPLQKQFYARLVMVLWGVLALTPFIILRLRPIFHLYCILFFCCIAFLLYDTFVPFRYVAPGYQGPIRDNGVSESSASSGDHVGFWVSYPPSVDAEDLFKAAVYVAPLVLAYVYRRHFRSWASSSSHSPEP